MIERRHFALASLAGVAYGALAPMGAAQESQGRGRESGEQNRRSQHGRRGSQPHQGYSESFHRCAEACSDCQRECQRCAIFCANLLSQGQDRHKTTLRTCLDCADLCTASAQIVSRGGPFSSLACEACADACKRCGEACEEYGDDPQMRACAEECFRCEEECRSMLRSARHGSDRQSR